MTRNFIAPTLAAAALVSATAAQAQQQACVNPADLADAVVYIVPVAFDAAKTACGPKLEANGFMAREGDQYIAPFRTGQEQAWPGAFRFLKTFMDRGGAGKGAKGQDMAAMLSAMPADALRPFVDALVGQMIAGEIKPDSCGKIERGLELLSPLPRENMGGIVAFIVEMTDVKNPPVCPATARK